MFTVQLVLISTPVCTVWWSSGVVFGAASWTPYSLINLRRGACCKSPTETSASNELRMSLTYCAELIDIDFLGSVIGGNNGHIMRYCFCMSGSPHIFLADPRENVSVRIDSTRQRFRKKGTGKLNTINPFMKCPRIWVIPNMIIEVQWNTCTSYLRIQVNVRSRNCNNDLSDAKW